MCLKIKTVMVLFSCFMCLFFQIKKKKSARTLSDFVMSIPTKAGKKKNSTLSCGATCSGESNPQQNNNTLVHPKRELLRGSAFNIPQGQSGL